MPEDWSMPDCTEYPSANDRWFRVKHATKQPASHGSGEHSTFLEPIEPDRHDEKPDEPPPQESWKPPREAVAIVERVAVVREKAAK